MSQLPLTISNYIYSVSSAKTQVASIVNCNIDCVTAGNVFGARVCEMHHVNVVDEMPHPFIWVWLAWCNIWNQRPRLQIAGHCLSYSHVYRHLACSGAERSVKWHCWSCSNRNHFCSEKSQTRIFVSNSLKLMSQHRHASQPTNRVIQQVRASQSTNGGKPAINLSLRQQLAHATDARLTMIDHGVEVGWHWWFKKWIRDEDADDRRLRRRRRVF